MNAKCGFTKKNGLQCKLNAKTGKEFCGHHTIVECPICFENIKSDKMVLSCEHEFHAACITQWYVQSDNCPVCRVSQENDHFIKFKNLVQDDMREKYKDAITSLEQEIHRLRIRYANTALDLQFDF